LSLFFSSAGSPRHLPSFPTRRSSDLLRSIRSFVIRGGRMTTGQQKAYDNHWPDKGLTVEQGTPDFAQVFGREAPLILEIGFGMGGSLLEMAKFEPEKNFIGIEVHLPGVGALDRK